MSDVGSDLDAVRRAHADLVDSLAMLTDVQARQPSLLPGWTVGHVLAHVARNADGMRNMVEGAAVGEVRAQYPGGADQRSGDIEAGAGRPAAELVADVDETGAALVAAFVALDAAGWARSGTSFGNVVPITQVPRRRRREVLIHHADLGFGYTWAQWPEEFVRDELRAQTMEWASRKPMGLTGLPAAALAVPDARRLAWLLGRAEIEGLGPPQTP